VRPVKLRAELCHTGVGLGIVLFDFGDSGSAQLLRADQRKIASRAVQRSFGSRAVQRAFGFAPTTGLGLE
jgi:hypothetical protein